MTRVVHAVDCREFTGLTRQPARRILMGTVTPSSGGSCTDRGVRPIDGAPIARKARVAPRPRVGVGQCRIGERLCGKGLWNGEFIPRSAERGADRFSSRALLVGHLLVRFVVENTGERRSLLISQSGYGGENRLQLFSCQQHPLGVGIRAR